mgnify:CR=1 FL=1
MDQQSAGSGNWRRSFALAFAVYFTFLIWLAVGEPWVGTVLMRTFGAGSGSALRIVTDAINALISVAGWYYLASHFRDTLPWPAPDSPRHYLRVLIPGMLALVVVAVAALAAAGTFAMFGLVGGEE